MSRATGALTLLNISNSTAQPRTVFLCVCNACTKEKGSYSKISYGEKNTVDFISLLKKNNSTSE